MTPLQIEILFWYYARAEDYRGGDFSASAVRDAIDEFRGDLGLLEPRLAVGGDYRTYRLTPRGYAYVGAVMALPLPVCQWVTPAVTP